MGVKRTNDAKHIVIRADCSRTSAANPTPEKKQVHFAQPPSPTTVQQTRFLINIVPLALMFMLFLGMVASRHRYTAPPSQSSSASGALTWGANYLKGDATTTLECKPITGKGLPLSKEYTTVDPKDPKIVVYTLGDTQEGVDRYTWPKETPFLDALAGCSTLQCVRDAHRQPKQKGQFNYPHFFIAGWAKSATTSLHAHLALHPQIIRPSIKELHYVDVHCNYTCDSMICSRDATMDYLTRGLNMRKFIKSNGMAAAFEATPNIATLGDHYAKILYELAPWTKLIFHMREPISRSISRYVHLFDKRNEGCLAHYNINYCLIHDEDHSDIIAGHPYRSYYSSQLRKYLNSFPVDQIMVVQFEDLTGDLQASELQRIKDFIGIDSSLPENAEDILGRSGVCRKCFIEADGWDIEESVYKQLVGWVKEDAIAVAALIDEYHLGDSKRWLENWEEHWEMNLKTCKSGQCKVQLT